jgi:murein L,D-transpeptidase YafK
MAARRKYEYLNEKVAVVAAFKENKNLKVFGKDDVLSQVASFKLAQGLR